MDIFLFRSEHFDVVLIDDQTMDFPLAVLEEIEANVSDGLKNVEIGVVRS